MPYRYRLLSECALDTLTLRSHPVWKWRMVRKQRREFNSLLHFSVCSKLLASQALLQESKLLGATGPHSADRTCGWLRRNSSKVMVHPHYSPELMPSDFHLFGSHKYNLTTSDAVVKHWFVLRCDTRFGTAVRQMFSFKGEYLEVWCVPSATRWTCAHQSQNKFLSCEVFVAFPWNSFVCLIDISTYSEIRVFLNTLRTGLLNCLNARSRGLIQSEVRFL